jgi:hypothetical protein
MTREFGIKIDATNNGIHSVHDLGSTPSDPFRATTTLLFSLCEFIRGMRHGLIVALDLPGMRQAIHTLLGAVASQEARANLVTLEQVLSTYRLHEVGAPIIKSAAPTRMVEIFDSLIANPLYRKLSHHAASLGSAEESAESIAAVTHTAKKLADRDTALTFGEYQAFIPSALRRAGGSELAEHFGSAYFPPLVPIGDAYVKAKAAWQRDAPDFIPPWPDLQREAISPPPGADLV